MIITWLCLKWGGEEEERERVKLKGFSCVNCEKYYASLERSGIILDKEEIIQTSSQVWTHPSTPPGFWELEFQDEEETLLFSPPFFSLHQQPQNAEKSLMIWKILKQFLTLFAGMKRVFDEKWVESEKGHTNLYHCWKTGMKKSLFPHSSSGKCHLSLQ